MSRQSVAGSSWHQQWRKPVTKSPRVGTFPDKDKRQLGYKVAKLTLGQVPFVGGTLQELLESVIGAPLRRRQEEWFRKVGEGLEELQSQTEGWNPRDLGSDPEFVTVLIEASERAIRTHHEEKIAALRNIVLNKAAGISIDDVLLGSFMGYVETLSPAHLKVLALMRAPAENPEVAKRLSNISMGGLHLVIAAGVPELARSGGLMKRIYDDLLREQLVEQGYNVTMTGTGLLSKRTTGIGDAFLSFISDPTRAI
jgi:hypothetical protein